MAVVDLICILSLFSVINSGNDTFKALRLFQVIRVFKLFRYSKTAMMILNVFKTQKHALIAVLYWATISLTTVGYGDIYPVTTIGRMVTMGIFYTGNCYCGLAGGYYFSRIYT